MDIIKALLGPKRCPWCTIQDSTRIERFFNGDALGPPKKFKDKLYWNYWVRFWDEYAKVWKIGSWIHFRYHVSGPIV